jgi:YfiH family protein
MWTIDTSPLGRIAVPPFVPAGYAVFCTTVDFEGRLNAEAASEITRTVRERAGIDTQLTTCTQVHGATVEKAESGAQWRECDSCDALWSETKGTALGIKIADCLPVSLIDERGTIANVHSGWRGAVQNITDAAIDKIQPRDAWAYLGPSIRACCFEVGEEVAQQFDEKFVDRGRAKPHVDLVAYTIDLLRARGFRDERISDSELCTRCEGSVFHSYRRVGKGGGRNISVVAQ